RVLCLAVSARVSRGARHQPRADLNATARGRLDRPQQPHGSAGSTPKLGHRFRPCQGLITRPSGEAPEIRRSSERGPLSPPTPSRREALSSGSCAAPSPLAAVWGPPDQRDQNRSEHRPAPPGPEVPVGGTVDNPGGDDSTPTNVRRE